MPLILGVSDLVFIGHPMLLIQWREGQMSLPASILELAWLRLAPSVDKSESALDEGGNVIVTMENTANTHITVLTKMC